jgi:glycosyltransferase involved in cell wall biosynthesis
MRILMLHDPYAPIKNGAVGGEDNLAELQINTLRELGHEVYDARFFDSGITRKKNQLLTQGMGKSKDVSKIVKSFKPEVIHTLNLNQRSGYDWMYTTSIPIVSSIHNFRLFCPASIAWRDGQVCTKCLDSSAINSIKYRCAGKIGAINSMRHLVFQRDYPQTSIPKLFLVTSKKMLDILRPIVPESRMRVLRTPSMPSIKSSYSKNVRSGWLFAGRFAPEKGIIELITNWPKNENLDIAGMGPLRNQILNLIKLKPNIKLIGTYPPGDHSIFMRYEGLVFPSSWIEGSPLVVMECLGTGTPVICREVSSASEQIRQTNGGAIISGELTEEKLNIAMHDIRENFSRYSQNSATKNLDESSIPAWKGKFQSFLYEAIQL